MAFMGPRILHVKGKDSDDLSFLPRNLVIPTRSVSGGGGICCRDAAWKRLDDSTYFFFNSAVQFWITVSGNIPLTPVVINRNRWPSRVTAYCAGMIAGDRLLTSKIS